MKRPYDLRHADITWRLNVGVPVAEVAEWAGNSVEVITRVYAQCVRDLEHEWIRRMNATLPVPDMSEGLRHDRWCERNPKAFPPDPPTD